MVQKHRHVPMKQLAPVVVDTMEGNLEKKFCLRKILAVCDRQDLLAEQKPKYHEDKFSTVPAVH